MGDSPFDASAWTAARLAEDRAAGLPQTFGRPDVTAVAYVFGGREAMEVRGTAIELALRETYRQCGRLKTTLVVNRLTAALEAFAAECGAFLRVDVDETLVPGDIVGFSRNMIRTLPERFDTPHMLNVHPDGFPLRPGLDEFVGRWDFVGGPWTPGRDDWITRRLLTRWDGAGNGGFALRTRRICELGAAAYRRLWKAIPDCYLLYEDIFFTRFLPRWQPGYAKRVSLAPRMDAAAFSLCDDFAAQDALCRLPFGFHSWKALAHLKGTLAEMTLDEYTRLAAATPASRGTPRLTS